MKLSPEEFRKALRRQTKGDTAFEEDDRRWITADPKEAMKVPDDRNEQSVQAR